MTLLLLAAVLLVSLLLIPLGLPGTWLMLGAALLYNLIAGSEAIGLWSLLGVTALAIVGEIVEFGLAARYTRLYGGSRRAGWGAILGGVAGAIMGVPVPVIGSVIGAFLGAFVGALLAEYSRGASHRAAGRVAVGALLGRATAAAAKVAIGLVMAVWIFWAAWV